MVLLASGVALAQQVSDTVTEADSSSDDPVDRTNLNKVEIQMNGKNNTDKVTAYVDDLVYKK